MDKAIVKKLRNLLEKYGPEYYCLYDWELTEEEQDRFKNAEIGETITIETPMVPVIIDDEDGYFIGMYTAEDEIPEEFLKEKTVQKKDFRAFLVSCKAAATVLNADVNLVVNLYSENDTECIFTMDEIDEMYSNMMETVED